MLSVKNISIGNIEFIAYNRGYRLIINYNGEKYCSYFSYKTLADLNKAKKTEIIDDDGSLVFHREKKVFRSEYLLSVTKEGKNVLTARLTRNDIKKIVKNVEDVIGAYVALYCS
ncbi:MAG: hypothetical protein ACFFD4_05790 [Candidatus Odinarchaeota archaeon]